MVHSAKTMVTLKQIEFDVEKTNCSIRVVIVYVLQCLLLDNIHGFNGFTNVHISTD